MTLYLYAIVDAPATELGRGLDGESLQAFVVGAMAAIAGPVAGPPSIEAGSLAAHETVVRRLAAQHEALLPARFGTTHADAAALVDGVTRRAEALTGALARVRGREQMTLRVHGDAAPDAADDPTLGPGARFLQRRARALHVEGLAPLRARLGDLVAAEKVVPAATPPLVASVYHLIARGQSARYLEIVDAAGTAIAPLRVRASGPWPAYGFAPDGTEPAP